MIFPKSTVNHSLALIPGVKNGLRFYDEDFRKEETDLLNIVIKSPIKRLLTDYSTGVEATSHGIIAYSSSVVEMS